MSILLVKGKLFLNLNMWQLPMGTAWTHIGIKFTWRVVATVVSCVITFSKLRLVGVVGLGFGRFWHWVVSLWCKVHLWIDCEFNCV